MHARTSGDKARGAERTRDDTRVEGRKGQVFCEAAEADIGALLDRETRSGGCSTFLRHRRRGRTPSALSLPRGTAVFQRSLRIFSHLAASTCLPRRLPRPALVLSFILRYPPLPSSPASSTSYLTILALATCLGESFISLSLSFLLPFRLRFAVVSPYFRANGGRHECLNIFPFSLFLPLHPLCPFTVTQRAFS